MTQVDVVYRYGSEPTEAEALALGRLREVYGVRKLSFEAQNMVRVEYDSTRLTEPIIHQLLRRTGLDIIERVIQYTPPEPLKEPAPESAPQVAVAKV